MPSGKIPAKILSVRSVGNVAQIARLIPASAIVFPVYLAGQYATIERQSDGTKKTFSIASAPSETSTLGYLEFYVSADPSMKSSRSSEFFFDSTETHSRYLLETPGGTFTLQDRAAGFGHIIMIATGTGLAPFRSMIRELSGKKHGTECKVTLLHSNKREEDLAYLAELQSIEQEGIIDFFYLPTVTGRTEDRSERNLTFGRVGDILNDVLNGEGQSNERSDSIRYISDDVRARFAERLTSAKTIMMVCGNPKMTEEIRSIAVAHSIPCVSEDS